jgi:membrane protein
MAETSQPQINVLKKTLQQFSEDECMMMAASLAYYMIFSLPGFLVIVISVAGFFLGDQAVRARIEQEIQGVVGKGGVDQIDAMMKAARQGDGGIWPTLIGVAVLIFGATGVVAQLQYSLNRIWKVKADPRVGGIMPFIRKRILSFAMILAIAFFLLVSLVVTTVLNALDEKIGSWLPDTVSKDLLLAGNFAVSLLVVAAIFAAMLKWLPDASIAWRDVVLGAIVTALLFEGGKFLVGLYLGRQNPSAYGPAAALVLILIWVYYSAMIFFLGAEFTKAWAERSGRRIVPVPGAVRADECPEPRHSERDTIGP